jgi:protein-L-isoaspartate(D-aspartate) O-methyltransferase
MTEALGLKGDEKTLEVGTGSGYQAAVLAELSRELYTVERIRGLLVRARNILESLGYRNIFFKEYNGTMGWPESQPYDAVLVTAGAPSVPEPLVDQLADGGRMVIPVGGRSGQELVRITKREGGLLEENLGGCRFVPLKGTHGW